MEVPQTLSKPSNAGNDKARKHFNWPVNKQDMASQRFFHIFAMELKTY